MIELIELELNVIIDPEKTLLFFDESQASPDIIPLLRYFYEELPELKIVCAGSLLDFVLNEPEFPMPVGRLEFLHLGPMSFEEFLSALGEKKLIEYLQSFSLINKFEPVAHQRLNARFREYILVGGMPEAVRAFAGNQLIKSSFPVKAGIISTYQLDFNKYKGKVNVPLLTNCFNKIPGMIGKKVKYSSLSKDVKSTEVSSALKQLELAKLIYRVCHSSANGLPLKSEQDPGVFKVIYLDIGLVLSQLSLSEVDIINADEINLVNNGTLAEQLIGQHLLFLQPWYTEPSLHYWIREKKASNAEVDYVISIQNKIVPIEVKAGKSGTLKSMQRFVFEKSSPLAVRFNSEPPSIIKEKTTLEKSGLKFIFLSLPLYMVGQTNRLCIEALAA